MTAAMVRSFTFETPRALKCEREASKTRGWRVPPRRRAHTTETIEPMTVGKLTRGDPGFAGGVPPVRAPNIERP